MKIRKIAAALAAVLCIGLAGCSDNTTDEVTTSAENSTTTTSEATEASETEASQEDTGNTEDNSPESEGEAANPLQHIADVALAVGEWPAMAGMDDPTMLEDFFLLDASNENYKNLLVIKCPMSANISELIIIEANDVDAAKADLEARQKKAQEQDAWYPDDVERAGASIVGTEGDYAYFIMCGSPDEVETAIVDYIKTL